MRVNKLVPIVLLSLFLCGQVLIVVSQAYAARCCMCGTCKRGCTCPGKGYCGWCAAPNPAEDPMVSEKSKEVRESLLASTVWTPDVTDRFLAPMRGIRGTFAMRVFDDVEDGLKFGCPDVDEKYIQGNITFALADTRQ